MPQAESTTSARADQRVLRVLAAQGLDISQRDAVVRVWSAQRSANEQLAEFLVRQDVLDVAAPQLLAMNWGDHLLISAQSDLFRIDGVSNLQKIVTNAPAA